MIERFTEKAREALSTASERAFLANNPEVTPWHLLRALIDQAGGVIAPLLGKMGVDVERIGEVLDPQLKSLPIQEGGANPTLSSDGKRMIQRAYAEADSLKDSMISTEHLFLALVSDTRSPVGEFLRGQGIERNGVLSALKEVRGSARVEDANPENRYQILERLTIDLVERARGGKLDPVIGRDEEVRRVSQVLSRRTKNNPVLIGEPGVGKTAIVEGLAQRIADGNVPEPLRDRKLLALDMGSLVAGTKFRGEFEERFKALLKAIQDSNGNIILFIDELHTLVGAGAAEGSLDASNMIKPALARGELRCIGATTLDEYRKHIERDTALERRFQTVQVEEPGMDESIAILRGLKERYEVHHGVKITDPALVSAVKLSSRYINDRFLPDKAIDLIDEAASKLRLELDSLPAPLMELEERIRKLRIEQKVLEKERDDLSGRRLKELETELAELDERRRALALTWENEKRAIESIRSIKERIEEARREEQLAARENDLERMGELRYGTIPDLTGRLQEANEELAMLQRDGSILREEVSVDEIAEIVSRWTGIPVSRMLESEKEKLLDLEQRLSQRVIGQGAAITAVSEAVRRARAGLSSPDKPAGVFMFVGPTGVGKTELAKALAESLFDDEQKMVRIDMSEFMEKHSVARLIGAPPGYVGYEEGGYLTEAVRRHPFSVILLDEIEKAHPDIYHLLLQILDDGRLTDGRGRTVDFTNCIIIMTSNLGTSHTQEESFELMEARMVTAVKAHFKPEFMNRLDDVIVFHRLAPEEMRAIARLQIERLAERLSEQQLTIDVDPAVIEEIAHRGYDPVFGARPLNRLIQKRIENLIARALLEGAVQEGDTFRIEGGAGERFTLTVLHRDHRVTA